MLVDLSFLPFCTPPRVAEVAVGPHGHHIEYSARCASDWHGQHAWTFLVHTLVLHPSSTLFHTSPRDLLYRRSLPSLFPSVVVILCQTEVSLLYFTLAFIPSTYGMQYRICIGEYI